MNENCGIGNAQDSLIIIDEVINFPLVDAHMHIQSNNIAPIPIMKGVAKRALIDNDETLKEKAYYEEISFLNPQKVSQLILDNPHQGHGTDFSDSLKSRAFITGLTALMTQYGKVTRFNSYYIAELYLSEVKKAQLGISSRVITAGRIRKNITESKYDKLNTARSPYINLFKNVSAHYYFFPDINGHENTWPKINAAFDFIIVHGMELMYAHYWGAYGIPLYITIKGKLYSLVNKVRMVGSSKTTNKNSKSKQYYFDCIYDIDADGLNSCLRILPRTNQAKTRSMANLYKEKRMEGGTPNEAGGTKYTHILESVKDKEVDEFEDHIRHLLFTQMAVLKYPFKYLPFYHFDPRRYFSDTTSYELGKYHDFYINHGKYLEKLEPADVANSINSSEMFHYKMSYEKIKNKFITLDYNASDNDQGEVDLGERKIADGLFWGVKMYVALGYPPYLSKNDKAKEIFPCLQDDAYKKLKDFYIFCAENDIPITCHATPQGMNIADSDVYLKEFLKSNEDSNYTKKGVSHFYTDDRAFINGLGLIADFSSPDSWELVLDTLGGKEKELRLCLAHFGGHNYISGEYAEDAHYRWFEKIVEMIQNDKYNIYTDISNYTFPNFDEFPPLSSSLYTEIKDEHPIIEKIYLQQNRRMKIYHKKQNYISSLENKNEMKLAMKLRLDIISKYLKDSPEHIAMNKTAEKLADLINDNNKLRHRIMFGTDWPMSELDKVLGVPMYNSAMFVLLQLVTRRLNDKFDAWHQFAVINPLRFLGVLKGDDNADEYTVIMKKFEKMKDAMLQFSKSVFANNMSFEYDLPEIFILNNRDVIDNINNTFDALEERFIVLKIPAAHNIKNRDEFLLISES